MKNKMDAIMALSIGLLVVLTAGAPARAALKSKTVAYEHEGVKLEGYLAWDDASDEKRPGILVVHEWWGLDEYARSRADRLAGLGYVAFAADMYGKGKVTTHPEQASEWMKQVNENVERWRARALSGLEALKKHPLVDPERLAAIGYCFGGSTVQQLAYAGADLDGVVSFHGSLVPAPENAASTVKSAVLICHGADDPLVSAENLMSYLKAMGESGLRWRIVIYGGAKHGFTNPGADKTGMEALGYSPAADAASWKDMRNFLELVFGG